ncbi:MAG: alpha/beta hydrolase [Acidobacteriota bacterium]
MTVLLLVISAFLFSHNAGVRTYRDLRYFSGPNAHPTKHLLDLYLPRQESGFPLLVFVHGGAWTRGDKAAYAGAYEYLGAAVAGQEVGVAVINYRLSPEVTHPEHVRDVARAVAWLYRNSGQYGWSPGRIYLVGHSAGAHLAALLAVDPSYLQAVGLKPEIIKGVVAISGVYDLTLGGVTAKMLYEPVFGSDPRILAQASPALQLSRKSPPFLVLYAQNDYPSLDVQARRFQRALKEAGIQVQAAMIHGRDHVSIISGLARNGDPVRKMVLEFTRP